MPAKRKAAGAKQDRRPQRDKSVHLEVVSLPAPGVPRCPSGLLESSRSLWRTYWESQVAAAAEDVDVNVVERWIVARDQWRRAMNAVAEAPIVKGSMGQPVQNPLMSWVASREATMAALEKQLGIGPKSRSDLGITIGQAQMTAAELNRMSLEPEHGDEDVDAEEAELLEEFEAAE